MANSLSTRNRPASAGPTSRQPSPWEQSSAGDTARELFEETQTLTATSEPGDELPTTAPEAAPFRSRYEGSPSSRGQVVASAQTIHRLKLETQALRRTQDNIQRQLAEVLTHLSGPRPPLQEAATPLPPVVEPPSPLPQRRDSGPAPPTTMTCTVYEKPAAKSKSDRFESKNFREYERWIKDVKNNFIGHTYSEAEKVSTAAAWFKGERQTRWIKYQQRHGVFMEAPRRYPIQG